MGSQNIRDKNKKPSEWVYNRNLPGITLTPSHYMTSLLVVPINVNGQEIKTVVDTGRSYTVIRKRTCGNRNSLKGEFTPIMIYVPQRVIMADGTIHQYRKKH